MKGERVFLIAFIVTVVLILGMTMYQKEQDMLNDAWNEGYKEGYAD